jgi:2-keto-4-pentenoate hydratase/2-oxohepta-3-ene-1,7-dioic acid hydratase in catechol pathway
LSVERFFRWFVSRVMTLRPGDIISTGTPSGVGPLRPGDAAEVEGVGTLGNPVVES